MDSNNTTKNTTNKKVAWAKTHLFEESILFISIIKWTILATVVGSVVGAIVFLFLRALHYSIGFLAEYNYFYWMIPLGILVSFLIGRYLAPESEGHGTDKVIESVHNNYGFIPARVAPVKFVTTITTIATGGSVGQEAPCAQIGATISSVIASLLRLDDNSRRKLVVCGVSAGFAAAFGTPIGGAIFGIEVLFMGKVLYDVLFPSFIAGIVSYQVSVSLGTIYYYHAIDFVPKFSGLMLFKTVFGGILFGLIAYILIEVMEFSDNRFKNMKGPLPVKAIISGLIIIPLALIFSQESLGLGLDTISQAVSGGEIPILSSFWKIILTSLTLSGGGSGGIITPIFFIGSTAGNVLSSIVGIDPGTLAAIGMVSVLAGAANTPIAASIIAIELFGPKIGSYAAISCITSFLIVGHRSVYGSQVISLSKSSTIKVHPEKGRGVAEEEVEFVIRAKSIMGLMKFLWLKGVRYKRKRAGKGEEQDEE